MFWIEFEILYRFGYKTSMQIFSKKQTGHLSFLEKATLGIVLCSAVLTPVFFTLAEQPIFRGDTSGGVSQTTFIIDENNQSGDLKLQFGNTLNEYIQWDNASSKFQISNNIDLLGNEINDFRVENQASAPTCDATKKGRLYYDTDTNLGFICNGSAWDDFSGGPEWTLSSGVLSPNASTTDVAIGGTTLAGSIFSIDESTGTFLFGGDQSANPTLNFEATDNDAGSLAFNANDTFAFSGAGVSIGTTTATSPLHVYENDALTDATAGVTIEQNGAGDALAQFLLTGVQRWVVGIDNSDSDKFKIGTTPLGSGDKVSIGSTTVQIGTGGSGTTTPLFFGLDVKSDTGDPVSGEFEGAMYYNTYSNKFRCYQGAAWTDCVGDLDAAFTNDTDKILTQNSATDLAVDLTSTGDFVIKDAGTAFATFADNGSISLGKASAGTTIGIGNGTGNDVIDIATGVTGTDTINIGTGGADAINIGTGGADVISIGSSTTASTSINVISGSSGGIKLRPAGDGATGNVQIGEDAGTASPDMLRLGLKNDSAANPSGSEGMIYYNDFSNKFRCYENTGWTDCIASGSGAPTGSQYLALATDATLTAERVLTMGTGLDLTDAGANGNATVDIDLSELATTSVDIDDTIPFTDVSGSNANGKVTVEDIAWEERKKLPNKGFNFYTDFIQETSTTAIDNGLAETNSGTGAATAQQALNGTNRPGLARSTTGTTATGRAALSTGVTAIAFNGGSWFFESAVKVTTLSTVTERFQLLVGFRDTLSAANQVDGVYFLYDEGGVSTGSTAAGYWQTATVSNSNRTFNTSLTQTTVNAGTWVRLGIEVNAAGTSVTFYIDGTAVATHTTNIPTGISRALGFGSLIIKSIGTTARTVDFDYMNVVADWTTPR